jgi:hypothetical protein
MHNFEFEQSDTYVYSTDFKFGATKYIVIRPDMEFLTVEVGENSEADIIYSGNENGIYIFKTKDGVTTTINYFETPSIDLSIY